MAKNTKSQTTDETEVSTEAVEVNGKATEAKSAQDELSELETDYKERRKELRATVRDEGKSAIVEKGAELANELYETLMKIALDAGQKINRFTIRLGDDGKAVIKSAVVRLPKNEKAVTVVEPDPAKQADVKAEVAAEKSGK